MAIFLYFGEEEFLRQRAYKEWLKSYDFGDLQEFNFEVLEASELQADKQQDDLSLTLECLPVMADRRVVVLEGADQLKEKAIESLMPLLKDYPKNWPETTDFMLLCDKIDKRKKWFKQILEVAKCEEFRSIYDNQKAQWIEKLAQENELVLSREVVSYIGLRVGTSLREIDMQLKKFRLSALDAGGHPLQGAFRVDMDCAVAMLSHSRENDVFEFIEAFGKRDLITALYLLRQIRQNTSEVAVVLLLARQLRILIQLRLLDPGLSGKSAKLAVQLGVAPFFLPQYLQQAKLWTKEQLQDLLLRLSQLDRDLKSGLVEPEIWLQAFLLHSGCR